MKKFFTLLATAMASIAISTAQPLTTGHVVAAKPGNGAQPFSMENAVAGKSQIMAQSPKKAKFSGTDGYVDAYGYVLYDNRFRTYFWSKFNTEDPASYTMLRNYGTTTGSDVFQTATFVGDRVFAQRCYLQWQGYWQPRSFGWYDPETTEFEETFSWTDIVNTLFRDMTYDPVTDKIYLVDTADDFQSAHIYVIDPNNPTSLSKACDVNCGIVMISADGGYLYGIVPNDLGSTNSSTGLRQPLTNTRLVKIKTSSINSATQTCELEEIRPSGMNISIAFDTGSFPSIYWQSMEFDKTNHRLWWNANTADGNSEMVEINPQSGAIISRNQLATNPEFVALCIPYQIADDAAPSYVRNLTATAGASGASSASFSWTNPTKSYNGEALTQLSGVKVYRDGQLITTVPTFSVGGNGTYQDTNVPTGIHNYKFVAFNNAGDGIYKDVDLFVGRDTPAAVGMPTLTANGAVANVSWNAPSVGQNGGWIDASSLTYKVVRYPDRVVITNSTTATSVTDNSITKYDGYYYEITPSTSDGEGASANTNVQPMGPAINPPYANSLGTQDEFNVWQVLDNNYGYGDGTTWAFESFRNVAFYYGSLNPADDYLISPAFNFEAGKEYQIRYTYYTINWVDENRNPIMEKMEVYYGQEPTAAGLSTMIKDLGEFHTGSEVYYYGKDRFTPQAGTGYVAFKATSEGNRGIIYLKDFSIREYGDNDLSVTNANISGTANATVRQDASVEVTNEGKATQSNYTVEIFNVATDEVLGSAAGVSVEPGKKVNVRVEWVTATVGDIELSARIINEGDVYPLDNVWSKTVKVAVSDATGARWFDANTDEKVWDDNYSTYLRVGWNGPFHMHHNSSHVQQIFLDSEMRKGVDLTGIQFVYDSNNYLKGQTAHVVIGMKLTDRTTLEDDYDYGYAVFDTNGFTTVFDGQITFDSDQENALLTIMFDTPFKYDGGNVLLRYAKPNGPSIDGEANPMWHFYEYKDSEQRRTGFYRGTTYYDNPSEPYTSEYATYTRFAYRDNETGINSARNAATTIWQEGDNVMLSNACSRVEVYNNAGARVTYAKNVSSISTRALAKGVYTVRAVENGNTTIKKIVVR